MSCRRVTAVLAAAVAWIAYGAHAGLPPVPVPAENPLTEDKRLLGKILFWDEQLSSDNTVACGSCHRPGAAGGAARTAVNPGKDGRVGTEDDVLGSPGIRRLDVNGLPVDDPLYGLGRQVTERAAPSYFAHLWSEALFWDGRAGSQFRDPLTGEIAIRRGGALEAQSLAPILNPLEMAKDRREWREVTTRLEQARPLALAENLPADVRDALLRAGTYPALFSRAFGDADITPVRIAFALATYERTLVADRTPWDTYDAAHDPAPRWRTGLAWFEHHNCELCHTPPLFTNNAFNNVGVRPVRHDRGRALVTGRDDDAGDMKVPSLRNVGLRTQFMHTGTLRTLDEVLDLYAAPKAPPDTLPNGERYVVRLNEHARAAIKEFLETALTDPRVAAESFPFDRPTLRGERHRDDGVPPDPPQAFAGSRMANGVALRWQTPSDDTGVVDFVLQRNGKVIAHPTDAQYLDRTARGPALYVYRLIARDAAGNPSQSTSLMVAPGLAWLVLVLALGTAAAALAALRRRRTPRPNGAKST